MPATSKNIVTEPHRNGTAAEPPACDIGGLNIEITTVTPALAHHWLSRGGKNRFLNMKRVDKLAAAMHRGEWRLTGEAIKLDDEGRVRDGQYRLTAVVKSGVTIQTVVVRGVTEDAFDVMDSGRARTAADVLGIHGYSSTTGMAAAARLLMFYERFQRFDPMVREASHIVTSVTTLAYLEAHPDVAGGYRLGDRVRAAGAQGGVGLWAAVFTLFLRLDAEYAHLFAHHLITGADMKKDHPALLLRERTRWRKDTGRKANAIEREAIAAVAIKAWNAFRTEKTLVALSWRGDGPKPEAFPKPI